MLQPFYDEFRLFVEFGWITIKCVCFFLMNLILSGSHFIEKLPSHIFKSKMKIFKRLMWKHARLSFLFFSFFKFYHSILFILLFCDYLFHLMKISNKLTCDAMCERCSDAVKVYLFYCAFEWILWFGQFKMAERNTSRKM